MKNPTPMGKRLQWQALALCAIFLLLQAFATYFTYRSVAADSAQQWTHDTLRYAQQSVDGGIQETLLLVNHLASYERLTSLAAQYFQYSDYSYQALDAERNLGNLLNTLILGYDGIENAAITFEGRTYQSMRTGRQPQAETIYQHTIHQDKPVTLQVVKTDSAQQVVFSSLMRLSAGETAMLTLTMKAGWLGNLAGAYENICIQFGDTIFHGPSQVLRDAREHPRDYKVITSASEATEWTFSLYTPVRELSSPASQIMWLLVVGFLASTMLAVNLSRWLVRRIMEPVELLAHCIEEAGKAHTQVPLVFRSRRKRLTDAVITYFLITCMIPICLYGVLYYTGSTSVLKTAMTHTVVRHTEQAAHTASDFVERINRLSVMVATDPNVQETLWLRREEEQVTVDQLSEFLYRVDNWSSTLGNEISVSVFDVDGEMALSSTGNAQQLDSGTLAYYQESNDPFALYELSGTNLTVFRRLRSTAEGRRNLTLLGYLSLTAQNGLALALEDGLDGDATLSIIREEDLQTLVDPVIAAHLTEENGQLSTCEAKGELFVLAPLTQPSFSVLCRVSVASLQAKARALLPVELIVLLALLLFILAIAYAISSKFTRSVEIMQYNLLNWYGNETINDLSTGIEDSEIAVIAKTFNTMDMRIKQLMTDAYQARLMKMQRENEVKQAELLALQAQIHPHFLYNTLESMKYMVLERRIDTAVEMIEMLGDLYHAASASHTGLVPLRVELEYARAYAELQCIRFEEALSVTFDIPEEGLDVLVPKLSVQPLIENAISHGTVNGKKLRVAVQVELTEDCMRLIVRNDGRILDDEALSNVMSRLSSSGYTGEGIGLVNVHRRVKLYFGDAYGTTIQNINEEGVEVAMTVPRRI